MANSTKKTTVKRTEKTTPVVNEAPVITKEKRRYEQDEEIMTTSCTAGELIMIGRKTGRYYTWSNYGDQTPVEYQDIKAEQYVHGSQYIYDPLFIIEDEEFLALPENSKIVELYQNILSDEDVDKLFNLDSISFERTVKNLPKGIKNSLKTIAAQKIQKGTLDSIAKIKALDKIFGTDMFNCYVAS